MTGDAALATLYDEVSGYPGPAHAGGHAGERGLRPAGVPLRRPRAAFFSTVATFGTAVDITVSELAIESFFPADAATAEALRGA